MSADLRMTPEQYLEAEKLSEIRHEFVDGVMHEMKCEAKTHNRLIGRLVRLLDRIAEARGCDVFFTVVKMRVPNNRYRYPDVVVTCEDDADEYMIQAPCAVFEVLSDSTEDVDAGEKPEEYLKIPSVQRYVLLRQDRALVMVYAREADGWQFSLLGESGSFDVPCIGATLTLEGIYAGILAK